MHFFSVRLYAQNENKDNDGDFKTLFSKIESHGGYCAFAINYAELNIAPGNISDAIVIGGKGAWIANHWFALGGGAMLADTYHMHDQYDNTNYNNTLDQDQFFIIEPGLELELNLVRYCRIAFGGYYRFTSGIDLAGVKKDALNGFSAGITLKFGYF
ncbi:MAG: hypothetical protein HY958_12795 [Bacteroidia bacterium]|nr:hypothetical protein [Bacteroidia bacterium]